MPREAEVPPDYLEEQLKNYNIFDKQRNLNVISHPIWQQICKELNLRMQPASLYLYIFNDRHEIRTNLLQNIDSELPKKRKAKNKNDDDFIISENPHNCLLIECKIETLKTEIFEADNTNKYKKQAQWSLNLNNSIKKTLPLQKCSYIFKNSWFTKNFFKFNGKCFECSTGIEGDINLKNIIDDKLSIIIKTYDTSNVEHTKKLQLRGKRRLDVQKKLVTITASEYREEELAKLEKNEKEPIDLNTTEVLKKAKHEYNDMITNYTIFKESSISNKEFIQKCSIRKLSLKPFEIFYWTDDQVELWNLLSKKNLPLSIDSTGSVIKKYSFYPELRMKAIFYYVLVIGFKKKILPLFQAILSAHHVAAVTEIFDRWLESGAEAPREIVSDGSLVLQNAICLSMNKMSFKAYNSTCFKILSNESRVALTCFYRHDIAHLIHSVSKWECFKQVTPDAKNFFLRGVGYLTGVDTIAEFKQVVEALIIVINSTSMTEDSMPYENKKFLFNIYKTFKNPKVQNVIDKIQTIQVKHHDYEQEKLEENESFSKDTLQLFIEDIFSTSTENCSMDESITLDINKLYIPTILKNFKNLCYTFPSWTNVMRAYFHSPTYVATSARSETYFKIKKKEVPQPMNVQKFIINDIEKKIKSRTMFGFIKVNETNEKINKKIRKNPAFSLESVIADPNMEKLFSSIQKNNFDNDTEEEEVENVEQVNVTEISNNASQGEEKEMSETYDLSYQNTTLSSVSETNLSLELRSKFHGINVKEMLDLDTVPIQYRQLIRNGFTMPINEYYIFSKNKLKVMKLQFIYTCGFDSVYEILVSMYCDSQSFKLQIDEHKNSDQFLTSLIEYCDHYNMEEFIRRRASFLFEIFGEKKRFNPNIIDCKRNVQAYFKDMMNSCPSLKAIEVCEKCKNYTEMEMHLTDLTINDFFKIGIKNLEAILHEKLKPEKRYCSFCSEKYATLSYDIQSYLAIDLEYFHETLSIPMFIKHNINVTKLTTNFDDIPRHMNVQGQSFYLKAVIVFRGDAQTLKEFEEDKYLMHYVSYYLSSTGWILYDDTLTNVQYINSAPNEKISTLIFTKN